MDKDDIKVNPKSKKTKKVKKQKNKHVKFYKKLSLLLFVLTIIMLIVLISKCYTSLGFVIPIAIISLIILFLSVYLLNKNNLRNWVKDIFSFVSIIFIIFDLLMIFFGSPTIKFLSDITDTGYRIESYGIYVLDESHIKSIKQLDEKKVIFLDNENDKSVKDVIKKIRKKSSIKIDYYDNVDDLVKALIDKKSDAVIMQTSFENIIKEEFNDDYDKLKRIDKVDVLTKVKVLESKVDITKDPFVIYISGIDSTDNINSSARSDVNLLLAVNPNTKSILIVNTPRDYYVKLHSKNKMDKLTHAGIFGVEESLHSLEDLYDTKIDYYLRINFTSFIKLVDALDGINVDVPIDFCEQNSNRSFSKKDLICLKKGNKTLNGEQALALARHRKSYAMGDYKRGENQMLILEAIINKSLSPKIITRYSSIINALKDKVSTNMKVSEMISFAKSDIKGNWDIKTINASGYNSMGKCYSTGGANVYVMEPNKDSIEEIKEVLKSIKE